MIDKHGDREGLSLRTINERNGNKSFWPQDLVLGLLPLLLAAQALVWAAYLPSALRGVCDFRQLYTGGYMVRTGHAGQLYDYETQIKFEDALVPPQLPFPLLITHPAFEEILFIPLSLLPFRTAFWIFISFNASLLLLCLKLLKSHLKVLFVRWRLFPALLLAAFFPITRALTQGQDSIIVLTLLTGAFVLLDRKRDMAAGILVGCSMFRFEIAIPIALLFLIWRRWSFTLGFAISSALAVLLSVWIVGIDEALVYIRYMLNLSIHMSSKAQMLRYGNTPRAMLNVRGLISAICDSRVPHLWVQLLILGASLAVLFVAGKQKPSLPLSILASSLVSYHFIAHDASIWFIPIALALCGGSAAVGLLSALVFVAPLVALFPQQAYLASIPLLALFGATCHWSRKVVDVGTFVSVPRSKT